MMPDALSALGRAAQALAARQRPVFPCRPDKRPYTARGFLEASTDAAVIDGWWRKWPAALIGMPTGAVSGLVVLDVDVREGLDGNEALDELTAEHGALPDTVEALTPSGGRHIYFRWPEVPVKTSAGKLGRGLDVRGDGGYVIVPPSTTGAGAYEWEASNPESGAAAMPPWLLDRCQARSAQPLTVIEGGKAKALPPREVMRIRSALSCISADDYDTWLRVGMALHSTEAGQQAFGLWTEWSQLSTKYDAAAQAAKWGSFKATPDGVQLGSLFTLAQAAGWVRPREDASTRASGQRGEEGSTDWRDRLTRTKEGTPHAHEANALLVLEQQPALKGRLRHDVLANRIEVHRSAPWWPHTPGKADADPWRPWRDSDKTRLAGWLGAQNLGRYSGKMMREAAVAVAELIPHNPVAVYLETVADAWDGVDRLSHLLPDYFGTPSTEYTLALGRNWLVSAVARALNPGCDVHFMLVLEGKQGVGKTRSIRALAGPHWYAEAQEQPGHKDFYQSLLGKWFVEIGEMSSFSRAEAHVVKQAITRASDYYRASYAETAADHLRACIFVGTTNEQHYLRDETGNRRFYPVRCSSCDVDAIADTRDQLWAEAVHLHRQRWPYWLVPPGAEEEQEDRRDVDSMEDVFATWLAGDADASRYPAHVIGGPGMPVKAVTVTDLLAYAWCLDISKHTRAEQTRAGKAMTALGWVQARPEVQGRRVRMYVRPQP